MDWSPLLSTTLMDARKNARHAGPVSAYNVQHREAAGDGFQHGACGGDNMQASVRGRQ